MIAQCTLPVFKDLLPEPHNSIVLELCHWHGLAKLQLHTNETLQIMDNITCFLRNTLHKFASNTCTAFSTQELKCEALCCHHHKAQTHSSATSTLTNSTLACQLKTLNLHTYKLRALGDYTSSIRMFGSMDSYSTQAVSTHVVMHQTRLVQ